MTENTQKQENNQELILQVNAQYIKDLSFEAPSMPKALLSLKQPPEIKINVDVAAKKADENDHYEVDLTIKLQAENTEDKKTLFLCELVYGGLVTLKAPKEHVEPLLLIEIPHLLFPYARAIIGNLVREAGLPSLQINPIDFAALYRMRLAQKKTDNAEK